MANTTFSTPFSRPTTGVNVGVEVEGIKLKNGRGIGGN
jgi:hypothetical protein